MNQKVKIIFLFAPLLALAMTTVACSPFNSPFTQKGSSSGGGGYGDESANWVLNEATTRLAHNIENSSKEIFNDLPKGWNQARLAKVIRETKKKPNSANFRDNRELMFDYRDKEGKQYIFATRSFFKAFASESIYFGDKMELLGKIREVQVRLLHEATHLMKIGRSEKEDVDSRRFALTLFLKMAMDVYICKTEGDLPRFYRSDVYPIPDSPPGIPRTPQFYFGFHKATGFGILASHLSPVAFPGSSFGSDLDRLSIRRNQNEFYGGQFNPFEKNMPNITGSGTHAIDMINDWMGVEKKSVDTTIFKNQLIVSQWDDRWKQGHRRYVFRTENLTIKENNKGEVINSKLDFEVYSGNIIPKLQIDEIKSINMEMKKPNIELGLDFKGEVKIACTKNKMKADSYSLEALLRMTHQP